MLEIVPITLSEAQEFIKKYHRHHGVVVGHKFSIGISDGEKIRGVAIIGRPVARRIDDGLTLEVTRCCTDGVKNGCSKLYAAAWRAAKSMGYKKMVTYSSVDESGASITGAGWKCVAKTPGKSWSVQTRPRVDKHPLQERFRWEVV